jgi:hypothetical protein
VTGPAGCRNRKIFLFPTAQKISTAQSDKITKNSVSFDGPNNFGGPIG